jgi:hypothetical protein
MAWARVDDGWWCHPKVLTLDLEARGLWVSALSWSCQQKSATIPAVVVRMCGGDDDIAARLVGAGLWDDNGDGSYDVHDWTDYQSERAKKVAAGKEGGKASGKSRREASSGASSEAESGASDEAGPTRPVPTQPDQKPNTMPPDGGGGGEIDADDPLIDDASDEIARQFDEYFWPVYPSTNGRKPEKGKALTQWRKLAVEQRRRAVIGARNLARSDTVPKYAHRFLRKDTSGEFPFDDWQQREGGGPEPIAPDACQQCGQGKADHDDQLCSILAEAS